VGPVTAEFSRRVTDVGDVHLVALTGELDMDTAEGLSDWLVGISGSVVVVDLSGLTFMDSSGISALVGARNRLTEPATT
jgi:anti-sigma B factor antagonist